MTSDRTEQIRKRLQEALAPNTLTIRDDSAAHAGHSGAKGGAGHYSVRIESESFRGLQTVARHRLVYEAVADLMPDSIHALSINAFSPGER